MTRGWIFIAGTFEDGSVIYNVYKDIFDRKVYAQNQDTICDAIFLNWSNNLIVASKDNILVQYRLNTEIGSMKMLKTFSPNENIKGMVNLTKFPDNLTFLVSNGTHLVHHYNLERGFLIYYYRYFDFSESVIDTIYLKNNILSFMVLAKRAKPYFVHAKCYNIYGSYGVQQKSLETAGRL